MYPKKKPTLEPEDTVIEEAPSEFEATNNQSLLIKPKNLSFYEMSDLP